MLVSPALAQELPDYYVEVEVSNTRPYVGQQIHFVFRLFSRVPSWTNSGLMVEPTYDGFWLQEAETQRYQAIVEGRSYEVRARNLALFPTRAGTLTIAPIRFVIPDDPFRAGDVLITEASTIEVQALPAPGDDVNFSGVVGQLELLPTIDRLSTAVGDPVQLQLTLRGDGNMAQLPIPALPATSAWRNYAAPSRYQETETAQSLIGEQTFTWLLTPLEAGVLELPIIDLSYFDPTTASYRSLSTSAVSIEVQPAETAIDEAPALADAPVLALRPLPANLSYSDSETPAWTIILWLLAPLITLGVWLRTRHLAHRRRYAALYRRSEALKKAHNILDQAGKRDSSLAYRMVWDAIMHYFADKLDQPASALDYSGLEAAMSDHQIKPEIAAHVIGSLQRSDQARYAPFAADDASALATQTMKILTRVDMVWQ
jgi:hypothetical protein